MQSKRYNSSVYLLSLMAVTLYFTLSGSDHVTADSGKRTTRAAQSSFLPEVEPDKRSPVLPLSLLNEEAPIPPMCYTKTEGDHNPCYVCHQVYPNRNQHYRSNRLDDGHLQGTYNFSEIGIKNQWKNLFVNREKWLEKITDKDILAYINQENYTSLPVSLKRESWQGFIPDLKNYHLGKAAFHENGMAKDGSGWVAFNYKPLPSTFWPTNGSTDDVLIRLPIAFRQHQGQDSTAIYQINLAITELTIKQLESIDIPPVNEASLGMDINNNGQVDTEVTTLINPSHYMGDAKHIAVVDQQFPVGTEFMHSVRYVGISPDNEISVPARMKELRYMKKIKTLSHSELDSRYARERKEKRLEELPDYVNYHEKGLSNGFGWIIQGFIENYDGELRPQTFEEHMFCMGCHTSIGTTIDQTFSFARKITGVQGWGYINLKGMIDSPSISQKEGEIMQYLRQVGGGNEFRENNEMQKRWFKTDGSLNKDKVEQADVYQLITPSVERALQLNKAYTHIVRHQSYLNGRDATWLPVSNVLLEVDESTQPLKEKNRLFGWDIRLQH